MQCHFNIIISNKSEIIKEKKKYNKYISLVKDNKSKKE